MLWSCSVDRVRLISVTDAGIEQGALTYGLILVSAFRLRATARLIILFILQIPSYTVIDPLLGVSTSSNFIAHLPSTIHLQLLHARVSQKIRNNA
jgi:hypothetical protein